MSAPGGVPQMPECFGARLRQHRESQNVALSTVAEQTKIKLTLLEALERGDVSQWPAGIFRRAYLRAYAQCVGLSPDDTLREFLEVHPDPAEVEISAAAMLAAGERTGTGGAPPTRLRNIVGSAIGSLSRFRRAPGTDGSPLPTLPGIGTRPTPQPHEKHREQMHDQEPAEELVSAIPVPEYGNLEEPTPDVDVHGTTGIVEEVQAPETIATIGEAAPSDESHRHEPDLTALASLCTALGISETPDEVGSLLNDAAELLEASGLIVWMWDAAAEELRPALSYGYAERVIAQLGGVKPEADNATATAFRSAAPCVIEEEDHANGALVLPLLTPAGCAGVLALELQNGAESSAGVRAAATILAAFLAQLVGGVAQTESAADPEARSVHSVA
jgi:transcriptional regulator with XRE-family HTH domain